MPTISDISLIYWPICSGACTIKHNGFVIYDKIGLFCSKLVSFILQVTEYNSLDKRTSFLWNP